MRPCDRPTAGPEPLHRRVAPSIGLENIASSKEDKHLFYVRFLSGQLPLAMENHARGRPVLDAPTPSSPPSPPRLLDEKLAELRRRWSAPEHSHARPLRVLTRVFGETILAAVVGYTVGSLRNEPFPQQYTRRAAGLGCGWALYYNAAQEWVRALRDQDDWINSMAAGSAVGLAAGIPYGGVKVREKKGGSTLLSPKPHPHPPPRCHLATSHPLI